MAASWVLSSVALATLLTMVEISWLCLARERSDRSCDDYRYFEGGLLTVFSEDSTVGRIQAPFIDCGFFSISAKGSECICSF